MEPSKTAPFIFGMLMVGPYNDRGWSQAHYDAGKYVEQKLPGSRMLYIDKVNPADRPGITPDQLAEELLAQGAQLIIFNSDDMKDGALEFARRHPSVNIIHASGDNAWKNGKDYRGLTNLCNVMGLMEYGEAIAGCAAALATRSGKIGYLGPLINDETRRLAVATYLGARYAWTHYLKKDPRNLVFRVTWIGFWFNIPGITSDPSLVADDFFDHDFDVVVSGLDTTEALVEARKKKAAGQSALAVSYNYRHGCDEAPEVCLGVPFFNWGPAYVRILRDLREGRWNADFEWLPPDWSDINNPDTSAVGYTFGAALTPEQRRQVEQFIAELAGGLNLWTGPLNFQDGSMFLGEGDPATAPQIWYLPQLLEGMEGPSRPGK